MRPTPPPERPTRAYLFGTCLIDLFDPDAGVSAVALLEREGIQVLYPEDQSCCGQPAWNSGHDDEARAVARAQLKLFPGPWPVIVPSASCAGMFRHHYPVLFRGTPEEDLARDLAARTWELTEFLVRVLNVRLQDKGSPLSIVVHNSCKAQREVHCDATTHALLAQLDNVAIHHHERATECCGFGGTFSVKVPEVSAAMVTDKVDALTATGATTLVSGDCGCMLNISGAAEKAGKPLAARHIASFLLERTR